MNVKVTNLTPFRYIVQVKVKRPVRPGRFINPPAHFMHEAQRRAMEGGWE